MFEAVKPYIEAIKTYIENNHIAFIVQILFGILLATLTFFRKFIMGKARRISNAFLNRLVDKIREEVVESILRRDLLRISYALIDEIKRELSEMQAPPLYQGISGTPCPKSGVYFSQQFSEKRKVYEEGEIFTETQDSEGCHVKTYWVREDPDLASYRQGLHR